MARARAPDQREAAPATARAVPGEPSLEALLASELNEHPGTGGVATENLPLECKLGGQLPPMPGGAVQEKAMEPWKGTPKPATAGNKPATAGNKPATTGNKPSSSSAKPTQSSCCHPAPSAKKPTSKK